jgi:serine/threonine protein kinase
LNPSDEIERLAEELFQTWLDTARTEDCSPREGFIAQAAQANCLEALQKKFSEFDQLCRQYLEPNRGLGKGDTLGDFRLIRRLGMGSSSGVWEAEQISLQRRVALKILHPLVAMSEKAEDRLRREAKAAGRIKHPAVVLIYGLGSEQGIDFLVSELVENGQTLSDWSYESGGSRALSSLQNLAQVFSYIAEAMSVAHKEGVLHRDLKPANILLTPDGFPKIADFGLAHLSGDEIKTASRFQQGTLPYTPPEVLEGFGWENTSDIYSLGATLFECVFGKYAFPGENAFCVQGRILSGHVELTDWERKGVPRDLLAIILKSLDREPMRRYLTMDEFRQDLRNFSEGAPVTARPPGWVRKSKILLRNHPLLAISSFFLFLGLGEAMYLGHKNYLERVRAEKAVEGLKEAILKTQGFVDLISPMEATDEVSLSQKQSLLQQREFLISSVDEEPKFKAEALKGIGKGLLFLEEFEEARTTIQFALGELNHIQPRDMELALDLELLLGWALGRLGLAKEAIPYLEKVRLVTGAAPQNKDRQDWATNRLGQAYLQLCSAEDETTPLGRGFAIDAIEVLEPLSRKLLSEPGNKPSILLGLTQLDLGLGYSALGRLKEGEESLQKARTTYLTLYGPNHPELIYVGIGLAQIAFRLEQHKKALAHLDEALNTAERIHPAFHPAWQEVQFHRLRVIEMVRGVAASKELASWLLGPSGAPLSHKIRTEVQRYLEE